MNPYETEIGELDMAEAMRAVQHCCEAFYRVKAELPADANGGDLYEYNDKAGEAFRAELPLLLGLHSFQVYAACVARGVAIGAIDPVDSSRYLYAAQCAMAAWRVANPPQRQPRPQPRAGAPLPSMGNIMGCDDSNFLDTRLPDRPTQTKLFKELRLRGVPIPSEKDLRENPLVALYFCDLARNHLDKLPPPDANDKKDTPPRAANPLPSAA